MLDIGWWELLVIGMVALVVVGPKELPTLLRTIGRYVGMAKRQADEFRAQFDEAMRESEFNDLRNQMNDIKSDVTSSINDAQESIQKEVSDIKNPGDEYDWDADGPIEPAPEFAGDEPTTSFTMPDGTVVKKAGSSDAADGDVAAKRDGSVAITGKADNDTAAAPQTVVGADGATSKQASSTEASSTEASPKETSAEEAAAERVAATRNAESVR